MSDSSNEPNEISAVVPANVPSSEEVEAKEANEAKALLLSKLGDARKALSAIHGEALTRQEMELLGIDTRSALTEQAEKAVELVDTMLDAVNGNDVARGKLLYVNNWPKISSVLDWGQRIFGML